jgi:flavin reductase (DIM6/NTAB) family NADH-FMN oxidoreductase RutF
MKTFDPKELSVGAMHQLLLGAVSPRPIAFASTVDSEGRVNLAPFSFFNVFSANPPILIFSPARRGRDNTTKHTYENVKRVPEVVVNIVNYNLVQQCSLASTEYAEGVNEFAKAGLTEAPSVAVKPPGVAESPVRFECKVNEIIELGTEGGAGNLIICQVLKMHVSDDVLNAEGRIDPHKLDAVARCGGDWYARISGEALFEVEKPLSRLGIGVDSIPADIRLSPVLTGNDLGMLGNVEALPDETEVNEYKLTELAELFISLEDDPAALEIELHKHARRLLADHRVTEAWKTLLAFNH